jgi:predicted nucleic acid-binding Zn ribbon protein
MKDILTSPRMENIKRKARKRRRRLAILFFILFVLVVWGLSLLSSVSKITINKIAVTGTRIINVSDVERSSRDIMSGKYLYLFSKSNIFIYPKNAIYKSLLKDFPRIENLSIRHEGFNSISIDIRERAGSYLYCGSNIPASQQDIGENCYFINTDGYVFDKAPYFSGNVYFKYYIKADSENIDPLGKQIIDKEHFHRLARFIDGLDSLGFVPTHMLVENEKGTVYLSSKDGDTTPEIIFKDDSDLDSILGNLSSSMTKPEFANEIRTKYSTLLYIDLRFDNKVVYKFKD